MLATGNLKGISAMEKVKTGVFGLNPLLDGGLNRNSTCVVIGASGAGKTTFATQFLRRGLEIGEDGIFITLDETPRQIMSEAAMMGWGDIEKHLDDGSLVFVDASGKQFTDFIENELSDFVDEWQGHNARIVVDPLTPVLWSVKEKYEQRELVSFLLRQIRKIGTVLCTLEEHGAMSDLSGPEIVIPMYLADCVIHLRYTAKDNPEKRELKIVKSRASKHSRFSHQYRILKGAGLIVSPNKSDMTGAARQRNLEDYDKFEKYYLEKIEAIPKKKRQDVPKEVFANIRRTVEYLTEGKFGDLDPIETISLILQEYNLIDEEGDETT